MLLFVMGGVSVDAFRLSAARDLALGLRLDTCSSSGTDDTSETLSPISSNDPGVDDDDDDNDNDDDDDDDAALVVGGESEEEAVGG